MQGTAELLFSGDELLRGDTLNTNQLYLAAKLVDLGLLVTHSLCVADDLTMMREAIQDSLARQPAVLVLSGGLGPTEDDLTREAVATTLGLPLELHQDILEAIRARFTSRGHKMSDTNTKQALLPQGAQILPFSGTAPGFSLKTGPTMLIALPGVPWELKDMWETHAEPLVRDHAGGAAYEVRRLRTSGLGESLLAQTLAEIDWRGSSVSLGTRADLDGITIILRSEASPEGIRKLDALQEHIAALLGDRIYSLQNESLPEVIGLLLRDSGLTIGVAESCTGGLLGKLLTDVSGSSEYFLGGVTAYHNQVKSAVLGVPEDLLATRGAVSEEVAAAMAEGVCRATGADCGLSTTGIAGPDGGSDDKPVGLVYVGCTIGDETTVERLHLFGGRDQVRGRAAFCALDLLRRRLPT